jgi:hypothetical protein
VPHGATRRCWCRSRRRALRGTSDAAATHKEFMPPKFGTYSCAWRAVNHDVVGSRPHFGEVSEVGGCAAQKNQQSVSDDQNMAPPLWRGDTWEPGNAQVSERCTRSTSTDNQGGNCSYRAVPHNLWSRPCPGEGSPTMRVMLSTYSGTVRPPGLACDLRAP